MVNRQHQVPGAEPLGGGETLQRRIENEVHPDRDGISCCWDHRQHFCTSAPSWAPAATTKEPYLAAARRLVYYADFGKVVKLDWIIKGILAKAHTSYLFGPPGRRKVRALG